MAQSTSGNVYSANPAENYERYFVPAIGRPVAEDLVDAASLRPGERVLDVACGTGVVTRLAAERVAPDGAVAGLDPNPGMLAVARMAAPAGTVTAWLEAPAESIPLPDESHDVVLCGMGLQFFFDRSAGLREMQRVLKPRGRLVANVPGPTPPVLEAMAEAISRHIGPDVAGFVHAVFALHDPDEIRSLVTDAGFRDVDVRSAPLPLRLPAAEDFLWQYVHSTPMAAAFTHMDEKPARGAHAGLRRALRAVCRGGLCRGRGDDEHRSRKKVAPSASRLTMRPIPAEAWSGGIQSPFCGADDMHADVVFDGAGR